MNNLAHHLSILINCHEGNIDQNVTTSSYCLLGKWARTIPFIKRVIDFSISDLDKHRYRVTKIA
jgi:hypothetical protein